MRIPTIFLLLIVSTISIAQQKLITGQVIDKETQTPLVGANIVVLGSTNGTITNNDGQFEFSNKYKNSIARVSHIGYKFFDIKLQPKSSILIELEKDATLLPTMNIGLGEYTGPSHYLDFNQEQEDLELEEETTEQLFEIVESHASFYGGQDNLYAFFASNFQYPKKVLDENLSGRVFVGFTVLSDGSVSRPKFLTENIQPEVKSELERVFTLMPKWVPATQRGKNVEESLIVTIFFAANR